MKLFVYFFLMPSKLDAGVAAFNKVTVDIVQISSNFSEQLFFGIPPSDCFRKPNNFSFYASI